jgi:hypothetical protein
MADLGVGVGLRETLIMPESVAGGYEVGRRRRQPGLVCSARQVPISLVAVVAVYLASGVPGKPTNPGLADGRRCPGTPA